MPPVFVLGSASPARLRVLRAAGLDPLVRVSDVDEDAIAAALAPGTADDVVVTALAEAKARAVAARLEPAVSADCIVTGCDSMLSHAGALLGKPHTAQAARALWNTLAGSSGELLTGHTVLRVRGGAITATARGYSSTTVHFAPAQAAEIDAYVATGEPLEVAGGFTLDGLGGWFIDGIAGDPSSVIGIGLPLLRRLLQEVDVSVSQLWAGAERH